MSEASYSLMLRNLSSDYYASHISFSEYRAQRKVVLDKIDRELNGTEASDQADEDDQTSPDFMQTISFFKNTDIEN